MKILIVTHYFPPEIGAPQARLSEFAKLWAEAGEDVTVLTGMPNHPTGVVPPEYKGAIRRVEYVDGYKVVRTWLYATPNEGFVKKTIGHLSFMLTSVLLGFFKAGKPDVVIVSSPTFFSIFSAWLISRLHRVPLVVEVRDLWPAIFVELGILKNGMVIQVLEVLELWCYRQAVAVVVVSEGFRRDLVLRGVPEDKIHLLYNGVDLHRFQPHKVDAEGIRLRLDVPRDDFLVLYIGAHGISHGLSTVIDAAAALADRAIHFLFVGEGAEKQHLLDYATELGIQAVTFRPAVHRDQVPDILQAADICLVCLQDLPLFQTFIPSKIFEFLAAGRPVIGAVRGESAEILRGAGAATVEPGDPSALAVAINELYGDPDRRASMGLRGRLYAVKMHDRRELAEECRQLLREIDERDRVSSTSTISPIESLQRTVRLQSASWSRRLWTMRRGPTRSLPEGGTIS